MKKVKSDKRNLIINKAIELFAKNGFENVKVSDITDSISIGKGTFYLYFENKQDLLLECFKTFSELPTPLEAEMDLEDEKDILRRMGKRLNNLLGNYEQFRGVLNLLRISISSGDEKVLEVGLRAYGCILQPMIKDIQRAIDDGIFQETDAELAALFLIGGGENLAFRLFIDDKYTPQQIVDFAQGFMAPLLRDVLESKTKEPGAITAMVTDLAGIETVLEEIRFGGSLTLAGKLGEAEIQMDPARVSSLAVNQEDSRWSIDFTLDNGKEGKLSVDGEVLVSGRIEFGDFQILLKNISKITFQE